MLIMHDMAKITEPTTSEQTQEQPGFIALQVREFPAAVARRMRAYAELHGMTTREVVVAALEQYLPEFAETANTPNVVEISR